MEGSASDILMARQPIFDKKLNVVAYELLYRSSGTQNFAHILDGNQATSEVLVSNFTSIFDNGNQHSVPAFINLTEDMISSQKLPSLDHEKIVLEVLESVQVTDEIINSLKNFAAAGYRIALDDFEYNPVYDPLLEIAHIVKVDLTLTRNAALASLVKQLKPFKVTLLAEKVETEEEFNYCAALGFRLFQGYFLSRPKIIEGRKISGNELVLLELLSALDNPKTSPGTLEKIIIRDPSLTFKLLRIVNSSRYALTKRIESLSQAIVLIGFDEIKKWTLLISLSSHSNQPSELTRQVLTASHMCESIAAHTPAVNASSAFLVGMLSRLHIVLSISEEELLQRLPMSDEIATALTHRSGVLGAILQNTEDYMAGKWDEMDADLNYALYADTYTESLQWSQETMSLMGR
ncbi:MAG: EAL and HDOD domain-containing protein [Pontibacterium sp.]